MPVTHVGVGRKGGRRGAPGFTLTELMVVVGVLALLAAMLLPYFHSVYAVMRKTSCQQNLHRISQALHTGETTTLATGYSWPGRAVANASPEILFCMEDATPRNYIDPQFALEQGLADFYILQYHTNSTGNYDCSFLKDLLAGAPVSDPQIWAIYPAGGVDQTPLGESWPDGSIPEVADNQAFIGIDNDSSVLITFGTTVRFEPTLPGCYPAGHSRHWVMKGEGTPLNPLPMGGSPEDEDDKVIVHLWGVDNSEELAPAVEYVIGSPSSYGINALVGEKTWRPDQIMLMDAGDLVVDPEEYTWDELREDIIRPRHMGKANVVTCGGSVKAMTLDELEIEYEEGKKWHP